MNKTVAAGCFVLGPALMTAGSALSALHSDQNANAPNASKPLNLVNEYLSYLGTPLTIIGFVIFVASGFVVIRWLRSLCDIISSQFVGNVEFDFRPAGRHELSAARDYCMRYISGEFTSLEKMRLWHEKNPQLFWIVFEKTAASRTATPKIRGYFSIIPLTKPAALEVEKEALNALLFRPSDICKPPASKRKRTPYAVYLGAIAASGPRARVATLQFLKQALLRERSRGCNVVYSRPVTRVGMKLLADQQFESVDAEKSGQLNYIHRLETSRVSDPLDG